MELIQHDTTAIVIESDGKYLLVKRAKRPEKGFWAFPGGHVDEGETIHECAVRECKEEVGCVEVEQKPFCIFIHDMDLAHRHKGHGFKGKILGEPKAGSDAEEVKWFSIEEIGTVEITHYTKLIFNHMLFGEINE